MAKKKLVIIGAGAAGYFTAIHAATKNNKLDITILERGKDVLEKVRISGGGRCNVTNACTDPEELIKNYPRGSKELLGPFYRFGTAETYEWFENHGVKLKIEADNRVFPVSNSSSSIINCFQELAKDLGIKVQTGTRVKSFAPADLSAESWKVILQNDQVLSFDILVICSGRSPNVWASLDALGLKIVKAVPSLFTFNIESKLLQGLSGVSLKKSQIEIIDTKFTSEGPLLVTHWGLSGPAVLKLSAWAARELFEKAYQFAIHVNWTNLSMEEALKKINHQKTLSPKKMVSSCNPFEIPSRLWQRMSENLNFDIISWSMLNTVQSKTLANTVTKTKLEVMGKSTFKEEFVTAGGVELKEIDFKKFNSKKYPTLFLAGEVLNIDAVTGGFNFQAAWTGAWCIGEALAEL